MRYLRHTQDGTIYEWNPILAKDTLCEEVTEAQAYPDRAPVAAKAVAKPIKKKATGTVSQYTEEDLLAEASRGMP
jgi:hypothetical protein